MLGFISSLGRLAAVAALLAGGFLPAVVRADDVIIVKRSEFSRREREHTRYAVELEPHALFPWTGPPHRASASVGLGFRASIPVLAQGPLSGIDDNLAVSFGLDWAHFGGCRGYYDDSCGGDDLWFPFVVQWNLFITPWWSVFPELGVAIHHATWGYRDAPGPRDACGGPGPGDPMRVCAYRDTLTELAFATWLGTRLSLSSTFSFVFRVGVPSLTMGVSFRL